MDTVLRVDLNREAVAIGRDPPNRHCYHKPVALATLGQG
jgi:hypothetical protein